MKWIVIALLAAIAALAVFFVLRRRASPHGMTEGTVMPYGTLRKKFFQSASQGGFSPLKPPRRPSSPQDFRIPRSVWLPVSSFAEPTEENWSQVHTVISAVEMSVSDEIKLLGSDSEACARLSPGRRAIFIADAVSREVNNGGFDQFFLNSSGNTASFAPESLRLLGDSTTAALVERANRIFPAGPPADRDRRLSEMERLGEAAERAWEALDTEYFNLTSPFGGGAHYQFAYIKGHQDEFFHG